MKKAADFFVQNPWIDLAARLCLGVVFVYASIHKMTDPGSFAKIIYGYGLFPAVTINVTAIVLPYIELITGLFLILGVMPRSAAVLAEAMLLAFIIAISVNLIRGHTFDCGCFSFNKGNPDTAGVELLVRDLIWFAVGLVPVMFKGKRTWLMKE